MLIAEGTVSKGVRTIQRNFASGKVLVSDCIMPEKKGFFERKCFSLPNT